MSLHHFRITCHARLDVHPLIHANILEKALKEYLFSNDVGIDDKDLRVRHIKLPSRPRKAGAMKAIK